MLAFAYVCMCVSVCLKSLPNEIVHYSVKCKHMLISQGLLGLLGFNLNCTDSFCDIVGNCFGGIL